MAHLTPTVTRRDTERTNRLDWLAEHPTFRFQVRRLWATFQREPQRHGEFWYAYKRIDGSLCKVYVGRAEDLTYARLVDTIEKFRYL